MSTIGWLFIFCGALLIRQVARGRVMNLTEDLGDAFIAFVSGDTQALGVVLSRTGDSTTPSPEGVSAATVESGDVSPTAGIANAAVTRGKKAKGYRWANTGPDYYDCSGLMWRACQDIGYKGSRFSTSDMRSRSIFKVVAGPGTTGGAGFNDLVLWPAGSGGVTGHTGVITGTDQFYSARSVRSGIGYAKISTFRKTTPIYLRYVGATTGAASNPFK